MHVFMQPSSTEDTLISVSNAAGSHTGSQHLYATSAAAPPLPVIASPVAYADVYTVGALSPI